ncbi:hypothetical protein D9M68_529750 [compost metagenome]
MCHRLTTDGRRCRASLFLRAGHRLNADKFAKKPVYMTRAISDGQNPGINRSFCIGVYEDAIVDLETCVAG